MVGSADIDLFRHHRHGQRYDVLGAAREDGIGGVVFGQRVVLAVQVFEQAHFLAHNDVLVVGLLVVGV